MLSGTFSFSDQSQPVSSSLSLNSKLTVPVSPPSSFGSVRRLTLTAVSVFVSTVPTVYVSSPGAVSLPLPSPFTETARQMK